MYSRNLVRAWSKLFCAATTAFWALVAAVWASPSFHRACRYFSPASSATSLR